MLPSRPMTDLAVCVIATCNYIFGDVRVRVRRTVQLMVHDYAKATPYLPRTLDMCVFMKN